ncbi:hypothetical protein EUBDOL_00485 [Amedibacillus dolichus DSM 3991]|uniref:Uncharacterized protein n=1 Tax=Amedibacillus dolichus DSM 3991 TaxID=428127 RepID=A8R949_9FIRM|nr:hypothetical protein EUBDOL_00485 [Amedibacillus dolichus DSM 3991]
MMRFFIRKETNKKPFLSSLFVSLLNQVVFKGVVRVSK